MSGPPWIKPPAVPAKPSLGATPRIATLPADASLLPSDDEMVTSLRALRTPAANAIVKAFGRFGDAITFEQDLRAALIAIGNPVDQRLARAITRLSAEAYLLDIHIFNDELDAPQGYIDRLDQLELTQPANFLHFAVRRLIELSSAQLSEEMQRGQVDRSLELLDHMASELEGERLPFLGDKSVVHDYQVSVFEVLQKHYELVFEDLFVDARGATAFARALSQLKTMLDATRTTDRPLDAPPTVPLFHLESGSELRDMFAPSSSNAFKFSLFGVAGSVKAPGPEIPFLTALKKRGKQYDWLSEVYPGKHPGQSATWPQPPALDDDRRWPPWARLIWGGPLMFKNAFDAFNALCSLVRDYFDAFTVHVPWDLEEGSGTRNYLTRTIPRDLTGALVHDCLVYAIRWIYFLSALLGIRNAPQNLLKPRVFLIEMPEHAGVLIRVSVPHDSDVLVAINNQNFEVQKVNSNVRDDDVFQVVVRGMYAGIQTPFVKHPLKSDVTDPNALWRELAAIADKKLQLPYNDVDAQLRYLHFNAEAAKIRKQLNDDLTELYRPVREADAETDKAKRARDLGQALATYRTKIKPKFEDAGQAYAANVVPVAKAIDDDFAANGSRFAKEATTVKVGELTKWSDEATEYDQQVGNAQTSLSVDDLAKVDPDYAYPGDAFPTEVP